MPAKNLRRSAKTVLALICAPLLAAAPVALGANPTRASAQAPDAASTAISKSVQRLVNRMRAQRGLAPLRRSEALDRAARWQSRDMVTHGYFGHQRRNGPSLEERIRRTGYLKGARHWTIGENIAWGEGEFSEPRNIVEGWMESSGHRRNILSTRFGEIGIGLAFDGRSNARNGEAIVITTDFGRR
jgi:uncharacterized protein YkwD